ncbi:MAG TPA: hypothetical protein VJ870_14620 [Amycolatopsis sp.]|nr:hypothetical protein [Amycolatopsis sp.]
MNKTDLAAPPLPGGFALPLGFTAGIAATTLAVATGATAHPAWSLTLLAVTVAGVAAFTSTAAAVGTAVLCWGLDDGFVLGRYGDLVATPRSAMVAAVLVATALVVAGAAAAVRASNARVPVDAPFPIPLQRKKAKALTPGR